MSKIKGDEMIVLVHRGGNWLALALFVMGNELL